MKNIWITYAEHLSDHRLKLGFNDGSEGVVDLGGHLKLPVFEPLKDVSYFRDFQIDDFTLTWKNGADFAPEFLHGLLHRD